MLRAIRIGLAFAGIMLVGCINTTAPREIAVLQAFTTIHAAEAEYCFNYGRFATSLQELGPAGANLIDRDLAGGDKGGYKYTLSATPAGYAISAVPDRPGVSGRKSYFSHGSLTGPDLDLDAPVTTPLRRVPLSSSRCQYPASALRRIQPRLS